MWDFVADNVTLGNLFLRLLQISLVTIIPPVLHIHSFVADATLS